MGQCEVCERPAVVFDAEGNGFCQRCADELTTAWEAMSPEEQAAHVADVEFYPAREQANPS